jgi:hypothetical protein
VQQLSVTTKLRAETSIPHFGTLPRLRNDHPILGEMDYNICDMPGSVVQARGNVVAHASAAWKETLAGNTSIFFTVPNGVR